MEAPHHQGSGALKVMAAGSWCTDPERYPELSDLDVVTITRSLSARAARRNLAVVGWEDVEGARYHRGAADRGPPRPAAKARWE